MEDRGGELEESMGVGGYMVMDGDLAWGGEHTILCRDDVL